MPLTLLESKQHILAHYADSGQIAPYTYNSINTFVYLKPFLYNIDNWMK